MQFTKLLDVNFSGNGYKESELDLPFFTGAIMIHFSLDSSANLSTCLSLFSILKEHKY